jgi:DNA-binding HxlR family transcriptional regulator
MAVLERKRHKRDWGLGNAGATPLSANALNERSAERAQRYRLTITAFLREHPKVKRSVIAKGLGVNQNTLQSQLQRLHSAGIINRSASNEYTNAVTV